MSVKNLLFAKQQILKAHLDVILSHPVTKGDHCEGAWIDFFRSFLPSKYAVDKGFVFDSKGAVSDQIDIIIYDAMYAPLIFGTNSGEKFVTAESVYAVFDSKQEIDKETLQYTSHKINTVTSLCRSARSVINAGQEVPPRKLTPIYGGILAKKSISLQSVEKYCKELSNVRFGCAIEEGSFLYDCEHNVFHSSNQEEAILAFFFIILDELYKLGTVAGIDIRNYADGSLSSICLKRGNDDLG
ncbi:DUF6602 domain-containing protein [Bifidobacterium biavatii]|nr:DUF6602 domain-containing protein [Bifidobacterium biavatii]